ncbi:MAG TPA: hypothetical protein VFO55_07250 [Gemmatimonadaceae bacterium]|nr:hypothetical protein [Gemmatimonadaceae bacterium]
MLRTAPLIILAGLVAACSKSVPATEAEPEMVGARMATNLEGPIARGDCREAARRAAADPNLDVEKVPAPVRMVPPAIDTRRMPRAVPDRNGWYTVKFHVLVDTAGRPVMKTFAVDTTSHAWLGTSVKNAVARWTFTPAEVAGCKVPRNFSLGITPRGKKPAPAAKTPAKPTPKPAAKKPPVG